MSKGSALTWATTYRQTAISRTTVTLGTHTDFLTKFNNAFKHHDTVGFAINWLSTARMNKPDGSIVIPLEKYIALFKSNIALAGISDPNVLVGYFAAGLHPKLMERMMSMETLPTTINKWYMKATTFQTQWQRAKEIATRNGQPSKQRYHSFVPKTTPDPNAMVVDVIKVGKLTPEEQKRCMEKGLCFRCRKAGHLSTACPAFPSKKPQNVRQVKEDLPKLEEMENDDEDEVVRKISFTPLDF
jgi:hypothetical protein